MSKTHLRFVGLALLCAITHNFGFPASVQAASPNMVRIHTWTGDRYFGPLIDESEDELSIFDIAAATTVNLKKKAIEIRVGDIEEVLADSHVPFASYAAWKLGKILKAGRLEATIVHNSEKGVFVNRGSEDGVETGRRCVLLGDPETIVDPTNDEVLGIIREQLGNAIPLTVVSERLSTINFPEPTDEDAQQVIDAFAMKRQVEIEQQAKRIVLAPPRWKPSADADSLTDDANFLHAHLISELVRYGFNVVSKKQTELMRQRIADKRQIASRDVPDIEIAKEAKADVLVSVDMLAKGITCQVQLQATDLQTDEYLGIVSGSTRRKNLKEESARSIDFTNGINAGKQLGIRVNSVFVSLFALADFVHFNDDGSVKTIRWGNRPMMPEQFALVCGLKSLQEFQCNYSHLNDSDVKKLSACSNIWHLGIWGNRITEESCETIANEFPKITAINIGGTKALTEQGAKTLATNRNLSSIYAFETNLTDEGLTHLATLPKLRQLVINNCKISDRGLASLHDRHSLALLDIRRTRVSKQGVEKIRAALPKCNVVSNF
ncbi:Leucine Rich repeats (2 copies) [Rosistilla ulvae]|uniref:Leucine Rich repeats (2 copies) n=1 Tax=Rosistilla ulvae TaxID=1930277 RepID=A0A517M1T6_9BACT|nr:hypothetical protein [Rosistilla ulvae]QDS88841.1 Leucine Rich repeats (2 copies) [Rosistilla ulvae]